MKNRVTKLIPLLFIPFLTACNDGAVVLLDTSTHIMSTSMIRSTDISYSTQKSDGDMVYKIIINEKRDLAIACEFTVQRGALTISAMTMDDEQFFEEIVIEDSNFSISLKEYASYKVKVHYDDFRGSYRLNWAKK